MKNSIITAGIAATLFASAAGAATEYGFEVGIGNSDNRGRTPTDENSETILTTGVDLRWLLEEGLLWEYLDLDLS